MIYGVVFIIFNICLILISLVEDTEEDWNKDKNLYYRRLI